VGAFPLARASRGGPRQLQHDLPRDGLRWSHQRREQVHGEFSGICAPYWPASCAAKCPCSVTNGVHLSS
jgi:hypothetical protein